MATLRNSLFSESSFSEPYSAASIEAPITASRYSHLQFVLDETLSFYGARILVEGECIHLIDIDPMRKEAICIIQHTSTNVFTLRLINLDTMRIIAEKALLKRHIRDIHYLSNGLFLMVELDVLTVFNRTLDILYKKNHVGNLNDRNFFIFDTGESPLLIFQEGGIFGISILNDKKISSIELPCFSPSSQMNKINKIQCLSPTEFVLLSRTEIRNKYNYSIKICNIKNNNFQITDSLQLEQDGNRVYNLFCLSENCIVLSTDDHSFPHKGDDSEDSIDYYFTRDKNGTWNSTPYQEIVLPSATGENEAGYQRFFSAKFSSELEDTHRYHHSIRYKYANSQKILLRQKNNVEVLCFRLLDTHLLQKELTDKVYTHTPLPAPLCTLVANYIGAPLRLFRPANILSMHNETEVDPKRYNPWQH